MRTKTEIEKQLKEIHSTEVHATIHSATAAIGVAAGGMAQLPSSDAAVITPIQIGMITGIGYIYSIRIGEAAAKSILGSFTAAIVGRTVSQWLVGWIPGVGNAINVATAVTLTESLGWYANDHFAGIKAEEIYKNGQMMNNFVRNFEQKIKEREEQFDFGYNGHVQEEKEYHNLMLKVTKKYEQVRLTVTDEENEQIIKIIQDSLQKNMEELQTDTFSSESPSFMMLKDLNDLLDGYIRKEHTEASKQNKNGCLSNVFLFDLKHLSNKYIKKSGI